MKKVIYVLTLFVMYSGFSQEEKSKPKKVFNSDLRKANSYFNRASYAKAIPLYENVIQKNRTKEIVERLATSYYNIGDLKTSARLYGYLLNRSKKNNTYENTFKYVQALKASGNYKDANSVMREYFTTIGDSTALDLFNKDVKTLENIQAIGERYTLKNLRINTPQSEFGMFAFKDALVFAASKKEQKRNSVLNGYYGWNNEPFLDIYTIHKDSLQNPNAAPKPISKDVNTKLHEATVAFSPNGKVMYFTRNNYTKRKEVKDDKDVTHLKLYKAHFIDSVWTKVEALPFNGDNYSVEHPALSPDGKRLYFASDMPESIGGFDLYYVDVLTDSTYSAPVNLGTKINTKHREQFPFIAANGDLYFSSNGHLGFGGLDVFWSKQDKGNFLKPENLGLPLNSGYDDFAIYLDETLKNGYVSSNRKTGTGSDDIYNFKEEKPLIIEDCKQYIEGIITDKHTKTPIANATVTIEKVVSKKSNLLHTHNTTQDGSFLKDIPCEISVVVKATAQGYVSAQRTLNIGSIRKKKNDASLALVSLAFIQKKEEEKKRKQEEKARELKKQKEERERELKKQKEEETLKRQEQTKQNREKETSRVIASEPLIVKDGNRLMIKTGEIYFDYKLWYIRRDVKNILKPVLALMRKYPKMQVEIESHTDIRGNKTYNRDLSQKRATSTKEYLVSQGIESYRITAIGYGESKPIIKCATEDSCSEEEHEGNRRSHFVIKQIF